MELTSSNIPDGWSIVLLNSVAKRGSGHTPDKAHPEYWGGNIKWISLQDSDRLDNVYISDTAEKITPAGIANSSARLLPAGTVVLSRDAGVGKSAIMTEEMAVSQHFIAWTCGPLLNNHFLYYWLQSQKSEFERIAFGNTIKTIGLPYFRQLSMPLPPVAEQRKIAAALGDVDALILGLDRLISKKKDIKQGVMQQLFTGKTRLPGFNREWPEVRIGALGSTYGGLTGKTKSDFGHGSGRYIPFLNVLTNVVIDTDDLDVVDVRAAESQNQAQAGDLFFNGSSETAGEVGLCSVLLHEVDRLYLNSFCFGFRPHLDAPIVAKFLPYFFRSPPGRALLAPLSQGAIRYNLSKTAFLDLRIRLPPTDEQEAITAILSDVDLEISASEQNLAKKKLVKLGMMQELLSGRTRLA